MCIVLCHAGLVVPRFRRKNCHLWIDRILIKTLKHILCTWIEALQCPCSHLKERRMWSFWSDVLTRRLLEWVDGILEWVDGKHFRWYFTTVFVGGVYDVTSFADSHPGGPARVQMVSGQGTVYSSMTSECMIISTCVISCWRPASIVDVPSGWVHAPLLRSVVLWNRTCLICFVASCVASTTRKLQLFKSMCSSTFTRISHDWRVWNSVHMNVLLHALSQVFHTQSFMRAVALETRLDIHSCFTL